MLFADKRALETNLKVSLLSIREQELDYYSQNCFALGTQAALVAGFAFAGLTQVSQPPDAPWALKLVYLLTTTTAMCLELIAVMSTMLLSVMGPGLALRGPNGSMDVAIQGMLEEYQSAYHHFVLGLVIFHCPVALFGWLKYPWLVGVGITITISCSLYVLLRHVRTLLHSPNANRRTDALSFACPSVYTLSTRGPGHEWSQAHFQPSHFLHVCAVLWSDAGQAHLLALPHERGDHGQIHRRWWHLCECRGPEQCVPTMAVFRCFYTLVAG